ncbi:hypothetical protein PV326_005552 [Microctonus aethiopoides]|nr:hypothetical protein PV326_005552 [Microctonus aethiopoides]
MQSSEKIAHAADVLNPHKRNHIRAGRIAIYHNKENAVNILTSQVELTAMQSTSSAAVAEDVGTTIVAVFSRYLDTIESRTYISYFSYHKPIVSTTAIAPATQNVQAIEAPSNVQISEIN